MTLLKTWFLKGLLIVLFPIGIYVWLASRKAEQRNAELEQENRTQHKAQVQREAQQSVVQQAQETHIESLEKESEVRANTTSRTQVLERMQAMRLRATKRSKKRFGGRR